MRAGGAIAAADPATASRGRSSWPPSTPPSAGSSRSARRRPARRPCSMRWCRGVTPAVRPSPAARTSAASRAAMADAAEAGAIGHHPDARDEGSRVLSGRTQHRPSGSGRDLVGAPAARPGRRRRRPADRRASRQIARDTRRCCRDGSARRVSASAGSCSSDRRRPARPASRPRSGRPRPERERLRAALDTAADELEALARQTAARAGDEVGAIFEAQALFARDPGIVDPALAFDRRRDGRADAAILRATDEQAAHLAAVDDEYFRGPRGRRPRCRSASRRRSSVTSTGRTSGTPTAVPAIIVADDLDPSAVATLRSGAGRRDRALPAARRPGMRRSCARGLGSRWCSGSGPRCAVIARRTRCTGRRHRRPSGRARRRSERRDDLSVLSGLAGGRGRG